MTFRRADADVTTKSLKHGGPTAGATRRLNYNVVILGVVPLSCGNPIPPSGRS
jgi:hypothetical protein